MRSCERESNPPAQKRILCTSRMSSTSHMPSPENRARQLAESEVLDPVPSKSYVSPLDEVPRSPSQAEQVLRAMDEMIEFCDSADSHQDAGHE